MKGKKISARSFRGVGLIVTCTFGMLIGPVSSEAQQNAKLPRVGYLRISSDLTPLDQAFLQALHELGYVENHNISIEYKFGRRNLNNLPKLAEELVRDKFDVIVALDPPAARVVADRTAGGQIPIVARGGLETLTKPPGKNVTGFVDISNSINLFGKRLEILKEVMPGLSNVHVLWNSDSPPDASKRFDEMMTLANKPLSLQLVSLKVGSDIPIDVAFQKVKASGPGLPAALIVIRNAFIVANMKLIQKLAVNYKTVAIYDDREIVETGGLMSYGTDLADLYRRSASYVHKILRGAKPAAIPMLPANRFELTLNLSTAELIGFKIPDETLHLADRVVRNGKATVESRYESFK